MPCKYLITGRSGQLAGAFIEKFESESADYLAPDEAECSITDQEKIDKIVSAYRPDVIINCAAYNLVDKAEQDQETAYRVNTKGPGILADAASKHGAFFVHYGSDYVFDGTKDSALYIESDTVNPLNVYGKSKLAGEDAVLSTGDRCLVLRLSWVFGTGRQNFINKLLEWSRQNEYLKITCDEFSVPTYTDMVVDVTLRALEQRLTGIYHLTNSGFCSRYEWARFIFDKKGIRKFIRPVTMDAFPLPAKRPKFSAMSSERISKLLKMQIPAWEEATEAFLNKEMVHV
jgi:dTDP-4-dehydrorhamnose reductase